jgi:hypothetical protein
VDSPLPAGDPPIIQVGAAFPVVDGTAALGTVTVLQHRAEAVEDGATRLLVEVRYQAAQAFLVRPDAWLAIPLEGEPGFGRPATAESGLEPTMLDAGEVVSGWLEFDVVANESEIFLDYLDEDATTLFVVALF